MQKLHKGIESQRIEVPFGLAFKSAASLIIAILLLILLFYVAYSIWYIIFYILFGILLIGVIYQSTAKINGITLKPESDPKIFKIANSVAMQMGVSPPHKIILTPDINIAVTGIFVHKLLLGVAALTSISNEELYSILFHEFAHFKGLDNVIGSSLIRTHLALRSIIELLSRSSAFGAILAFALLIFNTIFAAFILLYSRQREFLADYIASSYVGGNNFAESLKKYSEVSNDFMIKVNPIIAHYRSKGENPKNIYDITRRSDVRFDEKTQKQIEKDIKRSYERSGIFSTHPAIKARIERIRTIKGLDRKLSGEISMGLFTDIENKEEELTHIVYENMPARNL